jgi:hypothetical protein
MLTIALIAGVGLVTDQFKEALGLRSGQLPSQTARQLPSPTDNFLGGSFLYG